MLLTGEGKASTLLEAFAEEEDLPLGFLETGRAYYLPFIQKLDLMLARRDAPLVLGINGCQGSGKSILGKLITKYFNELSTFPCNCLSLDDFYLPLKDREHLASTVHPLLVTRGVPGTHDIGLLDGIIRRCKAREHFECCSPIFDKIRDDRTNEVHMLYFGASTSLVIIEGWCVGLNAELADNLTVPISEFEILNDANGKWRFFVNDKLANEYQSLFSQIDVLCVLQAPSFDAVLQWREEQEIRAWKRRAESDLGIQDQQPMKRHEITNFIEHFKRLTLHGLNSLPSRAHCGWYLNYERKVQSGWDRLP